MVLQFSISVESRAPSPIRRAVGHQISVDLHLDPVSETRRRQAPSRGTDTAAQRQMIFPRAFSYQAVIFLGFVGFAACGSVTPLGPDGGGTAGDAGTHGGAGTQGTAGAQGTAGSQGTAGAGRDAAVDGTAGSTGTDAAGDRAAGCPASFTALADGAQCPVAAGTSCDYVEGRCGCLPCSNGTGTTTQNSWACRAWDTGGTGCPARSPAPGSACTTPQQFCTYGGFCGISVGDDLECVGGVWQRMVSVTGSCALRMCAAGGTDAGADHPADTCGQAGDCQGGTCWLQLDGAKACVQPRATPTLGACQSGQAGCCMKDTDCTQPADSNGRCLPLFDVVENFCGGAVPVGNVCRYDQCKVDADCKATAPAGATVSTCVPSGAFGLYNATCVSGGCRTDGDCTLHAGGRCQYGQAATNGVCALRNVLYCAYPSDPCGNADSSPCTGGMICVPNDNYQGRQCGKAPPAYP
jgi:hypothetical protein